MCIVLHREMYLFHIFMSKKSVHNNLYVASIEESNELYKKNIKNRIAQKLSIAIFKLRFSSISLILQQLLLNEVFFKILKVENSSK